ncbi:hypothetical protein I6N96_12565 [Enterococcus sp. BWM-S5]|uniref:Uncharacterized protein n=1 Tax=Enterococcus larvae TaxID=2794352 RepID=A0ABS4CKM2_9ENTE|nr:hypothetical protein [Enterococcus larvae]MBP1047106.1 hypothetical protein [Enterococcus larvae]
MPTSLMHYAYKFVEVKGFTKPTEQNMSEVFERVVLPPKMEKFDQIRELILEEQSRLRLEMSGEEFKDSSKDSRCIEAMDRLSRLKINSLRNYDPSSENNFADTYFSVLHELDMWDEGEWKELGYKPAKTARCWLEEYRYLYKEYEYR